MTDELARMRDRLASRVITATRTRSELVRAALRDAPASTQSLSSQSPSSRSSAPGAIEDMVVLLMRRGNTAIADGDIIAARMLYERAAALGSAAAATSVGKTYDVEFLLHAGARGIPADQPEMLFVDEAHARKKVRALLGTGRPEARPDAIVTGSDANRDSHGGCRLKGVVEVGQRLRGGVQVVKVDRLDRVAVDAAAGVRRRHPVLGEDLGIRRGPGGNAGE